MKITDVNIAMPPALCELCGNSLRDRITSVDDKTTMILFYCPHNFTIIHCSLETIEGQRSVTKWILEGPVSDDQYMRLAAELGKIHGEPMDIHHTGPLQ